MIWNRVIEQVKVQWKHFGPYEATWEMVDQMRVMYHSLFSGLGKEILAYAYMYMDVNNAMSCVINLQ